MPKRSERGDDAAPAGPGEPIETKELIGDEEFLSSLRTEVERLRRETTEKVDENKQIKVDITRRLLQDLWEVHNLFDEIGIHMTIDPPHTSFAVFDSFPDKWSFKQSYDFSALGSMELKDRTPGWVGDSLRLWYYSTQEGRTHLRIIFEWCEGETYQKYSGWMRIITQAVLYDAPTSEINMTHIHGILKDVVVAWQAGHMGRDREKFLNHLREKYPKGSTQAKSL